MLHSEILSQIRKKLGLSQWEISSLLDMTQAAYCNCEAGRRNLSIKKCYSLIKLAKLKSINLSLEEIRPII